MPDRIQIRRVKGYRKPPGARVVTRATIFGNPWAVGPGRGFNAFVNNPPMWLRLELWIAAAPLTPEVAVDTFRRFLADRPIHLSLLPSASLHLTLTRLAERRALILSRLPELRGRDLACTCKPGAACHADVLMELANR